MATTLKFLEGTQLAYNSLETKEKGTFYLTDENNLYLGNIKLNNADDITAALAEYVKTETFNEYKQEVESKFGVFDNLQTAAKENLVSAINEVVEKINDAIKKAEVKVTSSTANPLYAAVYTITQGGSEVGTINIPKDFMVKKGSVIKVNGPDDPGESVAPSAWDALGHACTAIMLELNTVESGSESKYLYIDVAALVDIYTAAEEATAITLTINNQDYTIKAEIKNGGVTKAMLAADVLDGLLKAEDLKTYITTGQENGTIAVDGEDVAVKGLASAAYKESTAFDEAGAADAAKEAAVQEANEYSDGKWVWGTYPA